MVRPFRFGVISTNVSSHETWVSTAQKAEELGYSTLLVPDHPMWGLGTITAMASAAEATSSLRIGSFVFSNDFHHPVLLAQEVATLDRLSGGRVELGIGAGGWQADYTQTGITFDAASTRIRRLEEAVQVIWQMFTEEIVNFSGSFYTIARCRESLNRFSSRILRS
jgi:alkanesulfonate monooxygenase SsuD/methylene tetrahydromethanopterin reductase-like flavin-dependent oxidoreductase (luciferase family)